MYVDKPLRVDKHEAILKIWPSKTGTLAPSIRRKNEVGQLLLLKKTKTLNITNIKKCLAYVLQIKII